MAIRLIKEIEDFEELQESVWSGAEQVLKQVELHGLEDTLMDLLDLISAENPFSDMTDLNDFIWFDLEDQPGFEYIWDDPDLDETDDDENYEEEGED